MMQRRIICLLCILTIASGIHVCLAEQMEMDVWSVYLDEAENDEYIIDDPQYAWECVEINGIGYWRVSEMALTASYMNETVEDAVILPEIIVDGVTYPVVEVSSFFSRGQLKV